MLGRLSELTDTDAVSDTADVDGLHAQLGRSENLLRAISEPEGASGSRPDARSSGIYPRLLEHLENLVRSAADQDRRAEVLIVLEDMVARVVEAVAGADPDHVRSLLHRLEVLVRSSTDPGFIEQSAAAAVRLATIMARAAEAAAPSGPDLARSLLDRAVALLAEAEDVARPRLVPDEQAEPGELMGILLEAALPAVLRVMAGLDPERASALADHAEGLIAASCGILSDQARGDDERTEIIQFKTRALVALAEALAGTDRARAGALAAQAESIARAIIDDDRLEGEAGRMAFLALQVARYDPARADRLFDRVETLVRALAESHDLSQPAFPRAMRELLEAAAASPDLVHRVVEQIGSLFFENDSLARQWHDILAKAVVGLDPNGASNLFDRAEAAARALRGAGPQAQGLTFLAKVVENVDRERARTLYNEADTLAGSIADPAAQAAVLADLAEKAAEIDPAWARDLFDRAEALAHSLTDSGMKADALAGLAEKAATTDPDRTSVLFRQIETLLHAMTDPKNPFVAQAVVAHLVQAMTLLDLASAANLAGEAETLIRAISSDGWMWSKTHADILADLAGAVAAADPARAQALACSITDPERQAQALADLAVKTGTFNADRAETLARSIADPKWRTRVLAGLEDFKLARQANALVHTDPGQAEVLAQQIADPDCQALVLTNVAREAAPPHARQLIARALRASFWAIPLDALAQTDPAAMSAIADEVLQ